MSGSLEWNIVDDSLRFTPGEYLGKEKFKEVCAQGFKWWLKHGFFWGKWSPQKVDYIQQEFGLAPVDILDADDPEARADKHRRYADNAQARADAAHAKVERIVDMIPLGQPILVGHHSERRARRDAERIGDGMRKAIDEANKAEYYRRRAESALKYAEYRERPDVIYRRIHGPNGLAKQLRDWLRNLDAAEQRGDEHLAEHYHRWVEHLEAVIAFQTELYKQSGGIAVEKTDKPALEVGGAVKIRWGWEEIIKVNRKTVKTAPTMWPWPNTRDMDEIQDIKSREEWQAAKAAYAERERDNAERADAGGGRGPAE